jgi:hypothetical protein
MLMFDRTPFRCRRCERRFYSAHDRAEPETSNEPTEEPG